VPLKAGYMLEEAGGMPKGERSFFSWDLHIMV
jgi:hypothetical protein